MPSRPAIYCSGSRAEVKGNHTGARTPRPLRICAESLLYYCVAMMTIDGEAREGAGVSPDIGVPFDPRFAAGRDPQLGRAKDELVKVIEAN